VPTGPAYHETGVLEYGLKFPLGKGGKPLVLDSLLLLASFLLVPLFTSYGYSYRVGRAAARGDEEPPELTDLGGLTIDGLALTVLYIGAMVLGLGAMFAGVLLFEVLPDSPPVVTALTGMSVLAALVGFYVAGAFVPVLFGTGSVSETVRELRFLRFAFTIHYLKGIALVTVLWIASTTALFVLLMLLVISIIGMIVLPFIYLAYAVYITNMSCAVLGYVYNEAAKNGRMPPVDRTDDLGLVG